MRRYSWRHRRAPRHWVTARNLRRIGLGSLLVVVAYAGQAAGPASDAADEPARGQIETARSLAEQFMRRLGGELTAALEEGGPAAAIEICRSAAPDVAGELSRRHGWVVGRTALRVRNPRNAPSVRERGVLMRFQQRAEAGEDLTGMEHAAIIDEGGDRILHYMKAIPTAGVCLTCHGGSVDPAVRAAIHAIYPSDAATGFEIGELRGAFTFVKPLPSAREEPTEIP